MNRYQERKADVQRKLRVDKQQQLEGMCVKLEAANSKVNFRQHFQMVKWMTRKFQPRLQCIHACAVNNMQYNLYLWWYRQNSRVLQEIGVDEHDDDVRV